MNMVKLTIKNVTVGVNICGLDLIVVSIFIYYIY